MALFKETLGKTKDTIDWDSYIDSQTNNLAGKSIDLVLGGLKSAGQSQSREANQEIAQTQEDMNYQLNREMRNASNNQEAISIGDDYRGKLFANKKKIDSKVDNTLEKNKALWKEGVYYDDNGIEHRGTAEERQEFKDKDAATGYYMTPDGKVVKGNRNQQEIGQMRLNNQSLFEKNPYVDKNGKTYFVTKKELKVLKASEKQNDINEAIETIKAMSKISKADGGITEAQMKILLENPLANLNKILLNKNELILADINGSANKETTKYINQELNPTYKAAFKQLLIKNPKLSTYQIEKIKERARVYENRMFGRGLPSDQAIEKAIKESMNSVFN